MNKQHVKLYAIKDNHSQAFSASARLTIYFLHRALKQWSSIYVYHGTCYSSVILQCTTMNYTQQLNLNHATMLFILY